MDQFPTDVLKQENMMMMTYLSLTLKQLKQDPCFLVMSSVSRTCVSVIIVAIVSHWPGSPFTVSTAVTPVHQSDINIGSTLEISVLYDETAYGEDTGRKRMSEIWLDMGLKWFLLILISISSDRKNLTSLILIHINRFKSC